jgi:beta-galactosidase GanA
LHLKGDIGNATDIEIFAGKKTKLVTWNGKKLHTTSTRYGTIIARHPGIQHNIRLPLLDSWKVRDTLPERLPDYDDSSLAWIDADHVTTPNPTKPATLPVLYVDDYDIHNSFHIFRGFFNGPATAVRLSVQGGLAFGWSAWLNGKFLGSHFGNSTLGVGNLTLSFPEGVVKTNGSNVLLVTQDNTGHDLRAAAIETRGIMGVSLEGGANFTKWKIAGTAGRDGVQLDPVRGPLNEGGLAAERLGWHLPDFDDTTWSSGSPSTGFTGTGIQFYRTVVPLDVPRGLDVSIAFVFNAAGSKKIRVQLFVNGYQYGRFNPYVGNERKFPVPPGILNYAGDNTIGLAIWAQSEEGAKVDVKMETQFVVDSSWNSRFDSDYLRPGWTEDRLKYA